MKIYVHEAVTGGSMPGQDLPPSLVREAQMMVDALTSDVREAGATVVTDTFKGADAAWIIAPETGGLLERLSRTVLDSGVRLLNSAPQAIALAASKLATAERLDLAGLPVVPTFTASDELPLYPGRWVVKPDDGAGAESTIRCWDAESAQELLRDGLVAQPWIGGESLSLSLLTDGEQTVLMSINRQEITVDDDRVALSALVVNAFPDRADFFAEMGTAVVAALPGLYGWVGVDFIMAEGSPVILEVNPRLTTSYCGLRAARGLNPAALLLGTLEGKPLPHAGTFPPGDAIRLVLGGAS